MMIMIIMTIIIIMTMCITTTSTMTTMMMMMLVPLTVDKRVIESQRVDKQWLSQMPNMLMSQQHHHRHHHRHHDLYHNSAEHQTALAAAGAAAHRIDDADAHLSQVMLETPSRTERSDSDWRSWAAFHASWSGPR